ncbi:MAG TPA: hypothetical protein VFU06_01245 [Longimicrobiales bacterium]|nr:hypothetical protein [Longimicrobiales bacterium]
MSEFEYLSVLISIVLGLGLSHVMATAAQLVRYRSAVRFYLPALLMLVLLFLIHIQIWWAVFELRTVPEWSFIDFALLLALPTIAFMVSVLLSPDFDREEIVDLRARYYEHRRWFYGLFALLPLASLAQERAIRGFIQLDADPAFRLAFVGLSAIGFASTRERVHYAITIIALAGFAMYIGMLFLELA